MKVLIAGCGDLGQCLAAQLKVDHHTTYGLRRTVMSQHENIIWLQGDLLDPKTLDTLPTVDYVIYSATPAKNARDEEGYREIYLQGMVNLLNSYRQQPLKYDCLRRLFMVSSTSVYGQDNGAWVDESSPTTPQGFSGRILLEAEAWLQKQTVASTVVRFGGIYGPGRNRMVDKVKQGSAQAQIDLPKYTNRIHRDDCVGILQHLLVMADHNQSLQDCYVGVDDEPVDAWTFMSWLAEQVEGSIQPTTGHLQNKRCNNHRIKATGYRFLYPNYRTGYTQLLSMQRFAKE